MYQGTVTKKKNVNLEENSQILKTFLLRVVDSIRYSMRTMLASSEMTKICLQNISTIHKSFQFWPKKFLFYPVITIA